MFKGELAPFPFHSNLFRLCDDFLYCCETLRSLGLILPPMTLRSSRIVRPAPAFPQLQGYYEFRYGGGGGSPAPRPTD